MGPFTIFAMVMGSLMCLVTATLLYFLVRFLRRAAKAGTGGPKVVAAWVATGVLSLQLLSLLTGVVATPILMRG